MELHGRPVYPATYQSQIETSPEPTMGDPVTLRLDTLRAGIYDPVVVVLLS